MTPESELNELLEQLEKARTFRKIDYYQPYDFQLRFHHAEGHETPGKISIDRAIIAANKVGKTYCAAMEISYHATGEYPNWWEGVRFDTGPIKIMCASNTYDSTRDIMQSELFGPPEEDELFGSGTIPLDSIVGKPVKKPGVQNAFEIVRIRRKDGSIAVIQFQAYEQGFKKFMGKGFDIQWMDEEPPQDIRSQVVRATFAKPRAIMISTFTPEEGMTAVVYQYMNDRQLGQAVITATWDDAGHMTPEVRQARLALIPKHERDLRMKGIPISGMGLIFPVDDAVITVDPFEIPKHWPKLNGVDFGWDHPFAAAQIAIDRDSDCVYLTNEYRESRALPAIHAQSMHAWGEWVPTAWPHDGLDHEHSGDQVRKLYEDVGVNMLPWKATMPPEPGKPEGTGGNSREASVLEMLEYMETGRFKVFSSCTMFMAEKRMYHRKNGKIVDLDDDLISAVRYAFMMRRHAQTCKRAQSAGFIDRTRGGTPYLSARPPRHR